MEKERLCLLWQLKTTSLPQGMMQLCTVVVCVVPAVKRTRRLFNLCRRKETHAKAEFFSCRWCKLRFTAIISLSSTASPGEEWSSLCWHLCLTGSGWCWKSQKCGAKRHENIDSFSTVFVQVCVKTRFTLHPHCKFTILWEGALWPPDQ